MKRPQRPSRRANSRSGFMGGFRDLQTLQNSYQDLFLRPIQVAKAEIDYRENAESILRSEEIVRNRSSALGDIELAASLGMTMREASLGGSYLSSLQDVLLKNHTDRHELFYGTTGTGKTTCIVYPKVIALGMGDDAESAVIIDIKGEIWGATSEGRRILDGVEPITINPWCMYGISSTRLNLFEDLKQTSTSGRPVKDAVLSRIDAIHPSSDDKGSNAWICAAAKRISSCILCHLVECEPDRAYPATMADIASFSQAEFADLMSELKHSPACGGWVSDVASKLLEQYGLSDDPKYFEWVMEDYGNAWEMFGKGSVLREETMETDFDFTELKRKARTVYILIPPRYLSSHGKFVTLLFDVLIDLIAAARGPVRTNFICDEFVNLPRAKSTMQALRLYRGYLIRLVVFAQDRGGFTHYAKEGGYKPFEENSICVYWGLRDGAHMRDVQERAGYRYELVGGINASVGERLNSGGFNASLQRIPVLSVDEIGRICDGKAIIEVPGQPLFVVDRPFWKDLPFCRDLIRDLWADPLPDIDHL